MEPFTKVCPKPLLPFFGYPLLQYHFDELSKIKIQSVVMNVHHLSQRLIQGASSLEKNFELDFSDETSLLLDSAGGVRKAMELIPEEEFIVFNADTLSLVNLENLISHYRRLKENVKDLFGVLHFQKNLGHYSYRSWSFENSTGKILGLSKNPEKEGFFYTGTAVFHKRAFSKFHEGKPASMLHEGFPDWIQKEKIYAFVDDSNEFIDFGSPELFYHAHKKQAVLQRKYNRLSKLFYEANQNLWLPKNVKSVNQKANDFLLLSGTQQDVDRLFDWPSKGVFYQMPRSTDSAIQLEGVTYLL